MKKLLGIVVLGLLLSYNNVLAGSIKIGDFFKLEKNYMFCVDEREAVAYKNKKAEYCPTNAFKVTSKDKPLYDILNELHKSYNGVLKEGPGQVWSLVWEKGEIAAHINQIKLKREVEFKKEEKKKRIAQAKKKEQEEQKQKRIAEAKKKKAKIKTTKVVETQKKTSNNSNLDNQEKIYFTIADKKEQCEVIGFKPRTAKFADCVLRLVELDIKKQQSNEVVSSNKSNNDEISKQLELQNKELERKNKELERQRNSNNNNAIAKQLEIQNKELERQRRARNSQYLMDLGQKLLQPQSSGYSTCSYIDLGGGMGKVKCR
jgi:hypothetical protein